MSPRPLCGSAVIFHVEGRPEKVDSSQMHDVTGECSRPCWNGGSGMRHGNDAMMRGITAAAMSLAMGVGLVGCGGSKGDDAGSDAEVVETTTDVRDDGGTDTTTVSFATDDPSEGQVVITQEDVLDLPSGWKADVSFDDNVVVTNPSSSEMVMIETMANDGEVPTTARILAEAAATEDGNSGFVSDMEVDGQIWSVMTFEVPDNGGYAYHDNPDGTISKLVWSDCSFSDAIAKSAEYDGLATSGIGA